MRYLLKYIQFLWHSKNAHGVHSPFVYNLVTQCLLDFNDKPEYATIDKASAGNASGIKRKHRRLIFRIINYLRPDEVYYEGDSNTGLFNLINIIITNRDLQAFSPLLWRGVGDNVSNLQPKTQNLHPTTLHFIDANKKAAALHYFRELLFTKNNNTTFIFNNIYASAEMQQAWHSIKNQPEVIVSIDTFYIGIIFFQTTQAREHFKIRTADSALLNAFLGIRKLWGLID